MEVNQIITLHSPINVCSAKYILSLISFGYSKWPSDENSDFHFGY